MSELQRHEESIKNLLRAYITAMERGQPFSDVRGQLETAINKKRTTQGKKTIVLEGVSTRTRFTNINGEKRETKTVRLTYRKFRDYILTSERTQEDENDDVTCQ